MFSTSRRKIFTLVIALFVGFLLYTNGAFAQAPSTGTITGYAWSDTIGWISLNGATYGISVASNGNLSGYAWSEHIGWISANSADVSGCPSAPCAPRLANGALSGWLKALGGGSSQSGNWDGWISLKGSNYGPTVSNGNLSGYAWGSDVVGWVNFSLAQTDYTGTCPVTYSCVDTSVVQNTAACTQEVVQVCSTPYFCSPGSSSCLNSTPEFVPGEDENITGHLQAIPSIVSVGMPTTLHWQVENIESCTVEGNNGQSWPGAASGAEGQPTAPITSPTTFVLSCEGLADTSFTESVTVDIAPVFQER